MLQTKQQQHYALAYSQNATRQARGFTWGKEPSPLVVELLRGATGARALDLGCGDGRHSALLVALGFREVVGVDFSAEALKLCRARPYRPAARVSFERRDLTEPDALAGLGTFDFIVDYSVMDHVRRAELPAFQKNVLGALSPSGRLLTVQFDRHIAALKGRRDWVCRRGHYSRGFTAAGLVGAWPSLVPISIRTRVLDDALAGLHFNAVVFAKGS